MQSLPHQKPSPYDPVRYIDEDGYEVEEFKNLLQMREYIMLHEKDRRWSKKQGCHGGFEGTSYCTWEELRDKLVYGDEVATEFYKKKLATPATEEPKPVGIYMGIEGVAYDMGAVIAGEPECCLAMDNPENKKAIDIYVDIGYCCGAEAETIAYRGVAIVKLINTLISQGVIVNFHMCHYIDTCGHRLATLVTLPTDTVMISQVAFCCTPEYFRIISWLLNEMHLNEPGAGGRGRSMPSEDVRKRIQSTGGFYIPGGYVNTNWDNIRNQKEADEELERLYQQYLEGQKLGKVA